MNRLSIVSIALLAQVGSAVGSHAAESDTFAGITSASGTYKPPLLIVDGKRYELKASDKADASVAEMLAKFSKGDTGTYIVKGTRGTVNGVDGIIIDSITPTADSSARPSPAARQATRVGQATASYRRPATKRPGSVSVKDFGAKGDGVADDTSAVQSAINAATKSAGGGTVIFPKGTYLLNSAHPSRHPWAFHNLLVESNVTLLGETGAKLLQGPKGRHPLPERAEGVRNSVLAFGADHETIRFQNRAFNGGFFSLQATQASSTKVALKTSSESSKFLPGNYVAIYETTSGDVIPTETGQITTVNASTGELGLKEPLSRSFPTPSIANVTKLATTNIGIKNLIVEGSEPLTVTEDGNDPAEQPPRGLGRQHVRYHPGRNGRVRRGHPFHEQYVQASLQRPHQRRTHDRGEGYRLPQEYGERGQHNQRRRLGLRPGGLHRTRVRALRGQHQDRRQHVQLPG
jgi:hypothetical protein